MRYAVAAMLVSCAPAAAPRPDVRDSDLASWRNKPVLELETHALFSTLPRKVQPLSNGAELWDYANCESYRTGEQCYTTRQAFTGALVTNCSGGATGQSCCHNQFIVREGTVESFRAVGNCRTDCSVRPASEPCPQ